MTGLSHATVRSWDLWIGGHWQPSGTGKYRKSYSPANGQVVAEVADGGEADIAAAVEAAAAAQPEWAARPPVERGRLLLGLADLVRGRTAEIDELERADTGKIDARPELAGSANYFEMYGQLVRGLRGETIDLGPGLHAFTRREPWGVVGIITPWNAPFNQAAREAARRWRPATPSS